MSTAVKTIYLDQMRVRSEKKEKEIMKIKVTQNLSFFEARKIFENKPEVTFATIVQSSQIKKT